MPPDAETSTGALDVETGDAIWNAIATVRDASPRTAKDASTDDVMDAIVPLIEAHARATVAAELRRFANAATGGLIPNYTAACTVARALRARADQLDSAGG